MTFWLAALACGACRQAQTNDMAAREATPPAVNQLAPAPPAPSDNARANGTLSAAPLPFRHARNDRHAARRPDAARGAERTDRPQERRGRGPGGPALWRADRAAALRPLIEALVRRLL